MTILILPSMDRRRFVQRKKKKERNDDIYDFFLYYELKIDEIFLFQPNEIFFVQNYNHNNNNHNITLFQN